MPRACRKQSEGDVYHVFARGVGRQLIFEDDKDRRFFLETIEKRLVAHDVILLAWVLMGNHYHLLLRAHLDVLSEFMRDVQAAYAQWFNKRYERTGHLFQGRFGSQPIKSDEQLMACVRYIHRNPVEGGICKTLDYRWSSYRGYLRGAAVTNTEYVLSLFGGIEQFVDFHKSWDEGRFKFFDVEDVDIEGHPKGFTDDQAKAMVVSLLGADWHRQLSSPSKQERNDLLRQLKDAGLSVRQIERLTGIGRSIISRA